MEEKLNKQKRIKNSIESGYLDVYLMLIPTLLFYIVFRYIPMFGNIMAFQNFKITRGFTGSDFVGFKHFIRFFSDYNFWRLLRNTVMLNLHLLVIAFPMPIIFALLLNELRCVKFKKAVQTITYMPHFISTVIIASLTLDFFSSNGVINSVIEMLGGMSRDFMTEPKYFWMIYTITSIWQSLGWSAIIYLSALSSIDQELYEAATIDGAGRWKQTLYVTIPGILPTVMILLIMQVGKMLTVGYEKIILLYNPSIYETADVISTYVYRKGILGADYGYSTAVGLFNSVINIILLFTSNKLSKKFTGSGLY